MTRDVEPRRTAGQLRTGVFVFSSAALAALIVAMVLPNTAVPLATQWGGPHTIHEIAFTLFAAMVLVGLGAQIRRPRRHVGAMTLVVGFLVLLGLGSAITGFLFPPALIMLALAVVATATHPGSRRLLTPVRAKDPVTLGLAVVAAVPAIVFVVDQLALQRGAVAGDEHAELGHWVAMGAMALLLPALAAVAGWRPAGWDWPAAAAAAGAIVLGAASIGWPTHASSLGVGWGMAAAAWGLAVAGASLAAHRRPAGPAQNLGPATSAEVAT